MHPEDYKAFSVQIPEAVSDCTPVRVENNSTFILTDAPKEQHCFIYLDVNMQHSEVFWHQNNA